MTPTLRPLSGSWCLPYGLMAATTSAHRDALCFAPTASSTAAAIFGACFVHGERSSAEDRSVQRLDGLGRIALGGHLYECKTARLAGHAVGDDRDLGDGAPVGFK